MTDIKIMSNMTTEKEIEQVMRSLYEGEYYKNFELFHTRTLLKNVSNNLKNIAGKVYGFNLHEGVMGEYMDRLFQEERCNVTAGLRYTIDNTLKKLPNFYAKLEEGYAKNNGGMPLAWEASYDEYLESIENEELPEFSPEEIANIMGTGRDSEYDNEYTLHDAVVTLKQTMIDYREHQTNLELAEIQLADTKVKMNANLALDRVDPKVTSELSDDFDKYDQARFRAEYEINEMFRESPFTEDSIKDLLSKNDEVVEKDKDIQNQLDKGFMQENSREYKQAISAKEWLTEQYTTRYQEMVNDFMEYYNPASVEARKDEFEVTLYPNAGGEFDFTYESVDTEPTKELHVERDIAVTTDQAKIQEAKARMATDTGSVQAIDLKTRSRETRYSPVRGDIGKTYLQTSLTYRTQDEKKRETLHEWAFKFDYNERLGNDQLTEVCSRRMALSNQEIENDGKWQSWDPTMIKIFNERISNDMNTMAKVNKLMPYVEDHMTDGVIVQGLITSRWNKDPKTGDLTRNAIVEYGFDTTPMTHTLNFEFESQSDVVSKAWARSGNVGEDSPWHPFKCTPSKMRDAVESLYLRQASEAKPVDKISGNSEPKSVDVTFDNEPEF